MSVFIELLLLGLNSLSLSFRNHGSCIDQYLYFDLIRVVGCSPRNSAYSQIHSCWHCLKINSEWNIRQISAPEWYIWTRINLEWHFQTKTNLEVWAGLFGNPFMGFSSKPVSPLPSDCFLLFKKKKKEFNNHPFNDPLF